MTVTLRLLVAVTAIAGAATGCGGNNASPSPSVPAGKAPAILNTVSTAAMLNAINRAGLPAAHPHDVTTSMCPDAGCVAAAATDTVSILKFPTSGKAEIYAAAIPDMLLIEDMVIVYDRSVAADQKAAYRQVIADTMLGPHAP